MEFAAKFTIRAELDVDTLVQAKSDEIQWLFYRTLFFACHSFSSFLSSSLCVFFRSSSLVKDKQSSGLRTRINVWAPTRFFFERFSKSSFSFPGFIGYPFGPSPTTLPGFSFASLGLLPGKSGPASLHLHNCFSHFTFNFR